jgi:hypothetical protein
MQGEMSAVMSLRNKEIYIYIERIILDPKKDKFMVKITENPEEAKSLLRWVSSTFARSTT